jgi:hypothetical protein
MKNGFEATRIALQAMERLGMEFMVVGSLSTMAYSIPRMTKDADVVLSIDQGALRQLAEELGEDFELDPQGSFEMVTGTLRHHLRIPSISFEIELFLLSSDPHDQARFSRKQSFFSRQLGMKTTIPTAEDVIVMKARWYGIAKREKDADDIREIIAVQEDIGLDWDYIHRWADEHGTRELLGTIRASIPPID